MAKLKTFRAVISRNANLNLLQVFHACPQNLIYQLIKLQFDNLKKRRKDTMQNNMQASTYCEKKSNFDLNIVEQRWEDNTLSRLKLLKRLEFFDDGLNFCDTIPQ